jgi:hypothetical protein
MITTTYIFENGVTTKTVADKPEPTRESYAEACRVIRQAATRNRVRLVCNECGRARFVSATGNYNDRCPKCGGVDWDVE